jgi:hypothetical protein
MWDRLSAPTLLVARLFVSLSVFLSRLAFAGVGQKTNILPWFGCCPWLAFAGVGQKTNLTLFGFPKNLSVCTALIWCF